MRYVKPEEVGIASSRVKKFIEYLEKNGLSTHNLILSRYDDIFLECYWQPFERSFLHRMYSVSKSIVSLAIGFLLQDGKIRLDDKICAYFPKETENLKDENVKNQTIRDMLRMATAKPEQYWFDAKPDDRVRFYFENDSASIPPGTVFHYDSMGSFVLCALAERISGMELIKYLKIKLFDKIGVSEDTYCLKCPGGHSWGDSGILMRPIDLWKIARFVLNCGKWNGEQILTDYIKEATKVQTDNNVFGAADCDTFGYGYQFWRTYDNSYAMLGMGCQIALCVPDKELIMIYNGDNQGNEFAENLVLRGFFDIIAGGIKESALPENQKSYSSLKRCTDDLKLSCAVGKDFSDFQNEINNKTYYLSENPMGIRKFRLEFSDGDGKFIYENAQGNKVLSFGMGKNVYGLFPQEGYSDDTGTVYSKGNFYSCAASAAWTEEKKLFIKVQITDKYFGRLNITIGFKDDKVGLFMNKAAEDFLCEYQGYAEGTGKDL